MKKRSALNYDFSLEELAEAARKLPSKAMGVDRIHNRMLTNLSDSNRSSLLKLLNLTGYSGTNPEARETGK